MQSAAAWLSPVNLLRAITWIEIVLDGIGALMIFVVVLTRFRWFRGLPPLRWVGKLVCARFGIPHGDSLTAFMNALLRRYMPNGAQTAAADADRGVAYVERIVDRQINKARGILPFNSILMTFLSFEATRHSALSDKVILGLIQDLHPWILFSLAISSILMLELFWVHWSSADTYQTFIDDLASGSLLVRNRSIIIDMAIILSVASIAAIMLVEWIAPPTFT